MTSEVMNTVLEAPFISVIVPVYNVEKYLAQCIDSIITQSYRNFELILINDGSTDTSSNICDYYSRKDHRIRVIHKANSGVSAARNVGIEAALGEYITFIDSDDFVDHKLFEIMIEAIITKRVDLCVTGFSAYYGQGNQVEHTLFYSGDLFIAEFISRHFEEAFRKDLLSGPCHKLLRIEIIHTHNLRYDEKYSICEDGIFSFAYLSYCQTIAFLPYALYYYRQRLGETHLMTRYYINSFDALSSYYESIKIFLSVYNAPEKTIRVIKRYFLNRHLDYLSAIYRKSDMKSALKYYELKKHSSSQFFRILTDGVPLSSLSIKETIFVLLFRLKRQKIIHWYWNLRNSRRRKNLTKS